MTCEYWSMHSQCREDAIAEVEPFMTCSLSGRNYYTPVTHIVTRLCFEHLALTFHGSVIHIDLTGLRRE